MSNNHSVTNFEIVCKRSTPEDSSQYNCCMRYSEAFEKMFTSGYLSKDATYVKVTDLVNKGLFQVSRGCCGDPRDFEENKIFVKGSLDSAKNTYTSIRQRMGMHE